MATTTLNSADAGANLSFDASKRVVTGATAQAGVRATNSQSSGKYEYEAYAKTITTGTYIGIADSSASVANTHYIGQDTHGLGWYSSDGKIYQNGAAVTGYGTATTYATGDFIRVSFDATGRTANFYKNGTIVFTAVPLNTVSGNVYPAMSLSISDVLVTNFYTGDQTFYGFDSALSLSACSFTLGSTGTTWNPSDKATSNSLSNGNLTVYNSTSAGGIRATNSKATGLWYWELQMNSDYTYANAGEGNFGIADSTYDVTVNASPGSTAHGCSMRMITGAVTSNGSTLGTLSSFTTGDILGILLDATNKKISFYKTKASTGAITSIINLPFSFTGPYYPAAHFDTAGGSTASASVTGRFFSSPTLTGAFGYDSQGYQIGTPSGFFMLFQ